MINQSWLQLKGNRWTWRILQLVFIFLPLGLVFQSIEQNWQALTEFRWQVNFFGLALSVLLLVAAFGLFPLSVQQTLAGVSQRIRFPIAYWAYFITQLSKYLPGGIWIVPGRAFALQRYDVSFVASGVAMLMEVSLLIFAGIIVFVPYWLIIGIEQTSIEWWWPVLVIVPIAVFLNPVVFNYLFIRLLKLMGKSDVRINLSFRRLSLILLIDILFWLVTGAGFYFLVASVQPVPISSWLALTSAFSMAWVIGFLAFLTPAGFGVREGALALLLTPLLPAPLPALIALLARLWWTAAELISVALASLVGWKMNQDALQTASIAQEDVIQ